MTAVAEHAHGVPTNLTSGTRSTDPADFEPLSSLQEQWRFTPVAKVALLEAGTAGTPAVAVVASDGVGVTVKPGADAGAFVPADRIAAVTWANCPAATIVDIPAEADATVAVTVTTSAGQPQFARVLVRAGLHSRAKVDLTVTGDGNAGLIVELVLAPNSNVTFTNLNDLSQDATLVMYLPSALDRDAVLRSHVLTVSGGLVRVLPTVDYRGPGADSELNGAFIAGPGHHIEHRCLADHQVANCRSQVTYKGVLGGTQAAPARTVWIGDVLIHAAATGTDTYEMNRNLVLNDHARADSVPNLEIETGDIAGAGHASATGRLDDEQVFYLQSRGIDSTTAKSLIVRGFFEDLLAMVPNETAVARVRERLAEVLT
ncbi:MAG: SufD family Fe-S cluster assembly protein [Actinobacteria bacterium]|nr:SufD family Fe-S cluster assembly protein [Actinomycetota bacterium]